MKDSFGAAAVRELSPATLFSLAGRTAIVTGAAGGLGRWLAAGLGTAGARLLLTDVATAELTAVAEVLEDGGCDVETFVADLAESATPERLVATVHERYGRLDVLVNCAALNRRMPIETVDHETYDLVLGLDLRAPYFLSRAAAGAMREAGGGAIVTITSVNADYGLEQNSLYGPAKAALAQLTKVMAQEWSRYGIRANCIAPGFFDTPLAAPIWDDPDQSRWLLNRVPMERRGRPHELVGALLLLASDAGSFITGQTLVVDGGFLAGGRWFTPDR